MDTNLFILFVILNVVNVIIQTVKSLCTVKCGKGTAAVVNAVAYGLYTVVLVYTVCDLPLWVKVAVVGGCNLVGVFFVKWGEEIARKDKLWKVELTVKNEHCERLHNDLTALHIPHSYIPNVGKWAIFNCYAKTQKESSIVRDIANRYKAKYFASESKNL